MGGEALRRRGGLLRAMDVFEETALGNRSVPLIDRDTAWNSVDPFFERPQYLALFISALFVLCVMIALPLFFCKLCVSVGTYGCHLLTSCCIRTKSSSDAGGGKISSSFDAVKTDSNVAAEHTRSKACERTARSQAVEIKKRR